MQYIQFDGSFGMQLLSMNSEDKTWQSQQETMA